MQRGRIAISLLFAAAAAGIVLAQTISLEESTDYSLFGNTRSRNMAVSYTHLTLPTILRV